MNTTVDGEYTPKQAVKFDLKKLIFILINDIFF
jgi:hypothetical protein